MRSGDVVMVGYDEVLMLVHVLRVREAEALLTCLTSRWVSIIILTKAPSVKRPRNLQNDVSDPKWVSA